MTEADTVDLAALLRDAALAMDSLYPGCRRVRIVAETMDGQEAVLPVPAGRWVPHGESRPRPAVQQVPPADEDEPDESGLNEREAAIVAVCRDAAPSLLTRVEIAEDARVDRPPTSGAFNRMLDDLVDRKVLTRGPDGKKFTIFSASSTPQVASSAAP